MPGSGISTQFAGKAESTYATRVTPDRFWEIESEDIKPKWQHIDVPSLRAGSARFDRTDRHVTVITGYAGPVKIPMLNKNNGLLFEQALGQDTITTITGSARRHTCIPDSAAQLGKAMTIQVGRPAIDATVHPFTYGGGKMMGFSLGCNVNDPLMATFDMDFANMVTATSLVSASYVASQEPFVWPQAAVTIAGASAFVKGFSLKYSPNLHGDRLGLGNVKREPITNGIALVEGELECEFESLSEYNNGIAGTYQELIINFVSATMITGSTPYAFKIVVPKALWKAVDPVVPGPEVLPLKLPFKGYYDGTNAAIQVIIDSGDTAA